MFGRPQIRWLSQDKKAWNTFAAVVSDFLESRTLSNYEELAQTLLTRFQAVDCNMSVKVHYLQSSGLLP